MGTHVNIRTNRWTAVALLGLVLSGCGGGGGDAGDVTTFTVNPSTFTWNTGAACPGSGVTNADSVHLIIGGREPFRISASVPGLQVGLPDNNNQFVPAPIVNGFLVLSGQTPRFAIRTSLPCGSDVAVTVLDAFDRNVSVSIKVEGD